MKGQNEKKEIFELSVVIPVYNEDLNIEKMLCALRQNIHVSYEVIIVYDFDEDTTLKVLDRISRDYDNLRFLKNYVARGPSGALRTGFIEAKSYRVLVVMADLCDDLTQIEYLLSLMPAQADIVCPSRYCKGGKQELTPSLKAWMPRMAGFLLKWLAGISTYDPTNSFKLYSAKVLHDMVLTSTISFSVTLEIVAKAHCLGYRILEVPTVWRDRQSGNSKFKLYRSIFAYLPWFCVALLKGRIIRVPASWLRIWFGSNKSR
ncbi:MAG: glycosyltransferase [Planctomycetes bacterium]|uniref:glycosyltransferase n=1 Tax=Candidatus Wunengus sp. YC65 TaxID=3367701 RepID=UPI001D5541DD|nr:glycosyltransferase [Planctomycetota bacterium]